MRRLLLLFILLLCCSLRADDAPLRVGHIRLEFKRTEDYDAGSLLKRLKTKEGGLFSQTDFDLDLKMLSAEFDRVEPNLDFRGNTVDIRIELYPKMVIRSICFEGNKKISSSDLFDELEVKTWSDYDRETFNESFQKLRTHYLKKGFFQAKLSYTVKPDPCKNEVDICIHVDEGVAGFIQSICFEGLDACEEEEVLERIITQEYWFLTSWLTKSGVFQPEAIEHDKLIITDYLHNRGFLDARVEICTQDAGCERIKVVVKACKGERYYVGNICIRGNKLFTLQCLEKFLCIHQGKPFSTDMIRASSGKITDLYGSKGFIEAQVIPESRLRDGTHCYDITLTIDEGEFYRIGMVKLYGNCYTESSVILNECLLVPGEPFDTRKLKGTEERLRNTGFFECVNVFPVRSTKEIDKCGKTRDVHIQVKECMTGSVQLQLGFSTLDSLFATLQLTERNFNIAGLKNWERKGAAALRGGGENLQIGVTLGLKKSSFDLGWSKPYFMDTPWTVGFAFDRTYNRAVSPFYDIKTSGFLLHATRQLNAFVKYGWMYRLRYSTLTFKGDSNPTTIAEKGDNGLVSALGPNLIYDSTNSICKPTCGFRSILSGEYAGLGGNFAFLHFRYFNSYYIPFGKKGVFKTRADLEFIQPIGSTTMNDIPMGERLLIGGENDVRGYRGYSIGPKLGSGPEPMGAISTLVLSEEYLHNIIDRVDAFAFVDAGAASERAYRISTLRWSYGLGLRLEVMKGMPMMLGMGFPVNPQSRSDVQRFFISFGGRF